jgi:hypothetical protein
VPSPAPVLRFRWAYLGGGNSSAPILQYSQMPGRYRKSCGTPVRAERAAMVAAEKTRRWMAL